jgi:cytochrome c oxidase cbb3-type subunit 1
MWISGIMQGLMWRAINDDGTLTYSFIESVQATHPFYVIRLLGGIFFLSGMFIMAYNMAKTISGAKPAEADVAVPVAH